MKAVVILALSFALEVGFLLQVAVPAGTRPVSSAAQPPVAATLAIR